LRQGEGINSVAYEGANIAEQQRRAYPEILPLTVGLRPDAAFARALETAQRMGWTIVASDKSAGRIEASQRSRWMGFTDDIVVRVAPANSGSRIDLRSSSRYGHGRLRRQRRAHSRLSYGVARGDHQPRLVPRLCPAAAVSDNLIYVMRAS